MSEPSAELRFVICALFLVPMAWLTWSCIPHISGQIGFLANERTGMKNNRALFQNPLHNAALVEQTSGAADTLSWQADTLQEEIANFRVA